MTTIETGWRIIFRPALDRETMCALMVHEERPNEGFLLGALCAGAWNTDEIRLAFQQLMETYVSIKLQKIGLGAKFLPLTPAGNA